MTRHRETPHGDSTERQPRGEEGGVKARPDDLTEECWTGDHDGCTGYTEPYSDPELCNCRHHDDAAKAYAEPDR